MGHFARDGDALHVSAVSLLVCFGADVQPGRFLGATSFNQDITRWNTPALTNSDFMFATRSLPVHAHGSLTSHPRFEGATAWLAAYNRTMASSSGPPSAWSANTCTRTTCPDKTIPCLDVPLCFGPDGTCRDNPFGTGTPCDDHDNTTANDQCDGTGTCTGTPKCAGVTCVRATDCLGASTCIPTTGTCSTRAPRSAATPCEDGDNATTGETCDGTGVCTPPSSGGNSAAVIAVPVVLVLLAVVTAAIVQDDLSAAADALTKRCGLGNVQHFCGDALAPPPALRGRTFDHVMSFLCFLHIEDTAAILKAAYDFLEPGGSLLVEDMYDRGLSAAEKAQLKVDVFANALPSRGAYEAAIAAAGFVGCEWTDLMATWTAFTSDRLAEYVAAEPRHVRVHGRPTYDSQKHFYTSVAGLFEGGHLGGVKFVATKPP